MLLRVPLVRVLYEHGNFDATTQMVAWALLWYALGLTVTVCGGLEPRLLCHARYQTLFW